MAFSHGVYTGIAATPAAILDFIRTGKTGHHFGQQICHCRLGEKTVSC